MGNRAGILTPSSGSVMALAWQGLLRTLTLMLGQLGGGGLHALHAAGQLSRARCHA